MPVIFNWREFLGAWANNSNLEKTFVDRCKAVSSMHRNPFQQATASPAEAQLVSPHFTDICLRTWIVLEVGCPFQHPPLVLRIWMASSPRGKTWPRHTTCASRGRRVTPTWPPGAGLACRTRRGRRGPRQSSRRRGAEAEYSKSRGWARASPTHPM